jgi:hypothetical protein
MQLKAAAKSIAPCRAGVSDFAPREDVVAGAFQARVWVVEGLAGNEETRVNARVRRIS